MTIPDVNQFTPITLEIPAKLNLYLHAGALRKDGYHDITMVYQAISLYDTMTISPAQDPPKFTMTVSGIDSNRIPADSRNLVIKAAQRLANIAGISSQALHFDLVKSIPTEAGLGGGSADAAAALVGCNQIWKTGLDNEQLMEIGGQIGEDVPFFIRGLVGIGTGYHQPVIPVDVAAESMRTWHWVLGIMPRGLSTKLVFDRSDRFISRRIESGEILSSQCDQLEKCLGVDWGNTPFRLLTPYLDNNLQEVAEDLDSDIGVALQMGREAGAIVSLMAGTGTTCLFLAGDEEHAERLADGLSGKNIFRRVVRAVGPVEGVRLKDQSH
ncbi:4-diphosphocytidyl-2-C-methyl-D-erythritol kinase [Aspergillus pseudotamarii]|uniref:4-(cytidine 5'-diphospho)-2-C-methyl-D-erythritol kinase n=1 Tax=Aspergillus pseudotamarii TaxID=132259 RepID=A0A5N6T0H1_ASPPS|nr:4-diphosphocytidyl-2-C-methyl-D-erythritol kinase [Aspergillus pseudotamarii]KAE8139847.1 4-diphosphocytidyl-2-C-methyl-D-erythritol kinase [Aspergillus pseudotamarii]